MNHTGSQINKLLADVYEKLAEAVKLADENKTPFVFSPPFTGLYEPKEEMNWKSSDEEFSDLYWNSSSDHC